MAPTLAFALGLTALALPWGVGGYEVYPDEYAHAKLPGHSGDGRGLPNLPFSVQMDRRNDGVSSISPLNPTSPSFPYYEATTDPTVEDRRNHTRLLAASAAEQGVAGRGAGEYERELAVRALFPEAAARAADDDNATLDFGPAPSRSFLVRAATRWNPSAFAIQRGERYTIEVEGWQFWHDGFVRVDSRGYTAEYDAVSRCWVAAGRCRSQVAARRRLEAPGANWFTLTCGVGDHFWKLQEVAHGHERYLPLREDELVPTLFVVGANLTFVARHTGELVCFANDAEGQYWDNQGAIRANVTRASWPPVAHSDYAGLIADGPAIYADRVARDREYTGEVGAGGRDPYF